MNQFEKLKTAEEFEEALEVFRKLGMSPAAALEGARQLLEDKVTCPHCGEDTCHCTAPKPDKLDRIIDLLESIDSRLGELNEN